MNLETLWDRLNDAVNTIIRRDESSESGELLPPCVEGKYMVTFQVLGSNGQAVLCVFLYCKCIRFGWFFVIHLYELKPLVILVLFFLCFFSGIQLHLTLVAFRYELLEANAIPIRGPILLQEDKNLHLLLPPHWIKLLTKDACQYHRYTLATS